VTVGFEHGLYQRHCDRHQPQPFGQKL
jgi:hypothetical protein